MLGPDDQPLVRRYFCSVDGKPLAQDDIVRGYENDDGSFTIVADEELDALAPRKSRDIDLRRFVKRDEIPRQLLERPYVLAPAGESTKAYHLLARDDGARRQGRHRDVRHARQGVSRGDLRRRRHAARRDDALRSRSCARRTTSGLPPQARAPAERRQEMERALAELDGGRARLEAARRRVRGALLELAEAKRDADRDVVEIEEAPADDEESADIIDIMAVLKERMGGSRAQAGARAAGRAASAAPRALHERDDFEGKSKKELYEQAKKLELPGPQRDVARRAGRRVA